MFCIELSGRFNEGRIRRKERKYITGEKGKLSDCKIMVNFKELLLLNEIKDG